MPTRRKTILVEIAEELFLECYRYLLRLTGVFIFFLWGGRDGGKSQFIAQALVKKCLTAKRFRCLLIKKTQNSIKEAQFQTIVDVINDWGLQQLFTVKISPLEIECINGNRFLARGCDDPQNIKSTKDPTDAWIEEGNQLTYDDFIIIITTLRSNAVEPQVWFSFNPECVGRFEDFWLYKIYFKKHIEQETYTFQDTTNIEIETDEGTLIVPITYTSTHTTYKNNRYCSPIRRAFLEQLKTTAPYRYIIYTLGKWGNRQIDMPFAFAFDRQKHLGKTEVDPRYPVILSFDFNRNPITCFVVQLLPGFKTRGIEQIKLPNSNIYALCSYIKPKYGRYVLQVTGDSTGTGTNAMVKDELNYYRIIKVQLNLSGAQFKVPKKNPNVEDNQVLVNAILQHTDCVFDEDNCAGLIFDFENVESLPGGGINKANRNNPAMQADALDCFRYYGNTFLGVYVLTMMGRQNSVKVKQPGELPPPWWMKK